MARRKKNLFRRLASSKALWLLAILIVGAAWAIAAHHDTPRGSSTNSSTPPNYVNLNPPTEAEKKDAQANKDNLAQPPSPPPTTSSGKLQVTPVVTSATKTQVSGYVAGVFEDGGSCTATLTKGSQTITGKSSGFADANHTTCAPISLSGVDSGAWSVVLSYSSAKAEGKSNPLTFNL